MDFLTFKVKKTFIYLQKAFIKSSILWYFDLKNCIQIKTNVLRNVIDRVLNKITLGHPDQHSFHHVTHKNHFDFIKSEIG